MAERLKHKFLEEEKMVDIVVGPDAYKDLPNLLQEAEANREAVNVILSKEETYGDITPVRLDSNGVSAFVSITRGCDNMCTFCVVPFTRGRERSRDPKSILEEVNQLAKKGFKEITLLGQNVDSYLWYGGGLKKDFEAATALQQKTAAAWVAATGGPPSGSGHPENASGGLGDGSGRDPKETLKRPQRESKETLKRP